MSCAVPVCTMRPPSRMVTLSPSLSASSRSWLTNRMVLLHPLLQRQQLVLQLAPDQRIERRERLVHQQDVRIGGKGTRESDALLHAAGELAAYSARPTATGRPVPAADRRSARRFSGGSPRSSRPKPTLSRTVRHGSRPNCWNTMAMRWRRMRRSVAASQFAPMSTPGIAVTDQYLAARDEVQAVRRAQQRGLAGARQAHQHRDLPARHRQGRVRPRRPRRRFFRRSRCACRRHRAR